MEFVITNPSLLKKSMEIISDIVFEGTFVCKKDYLELVALNANNMVMVIFRFLAINFEKYEIEEETKLSLNLENFSNILKKCSDSSKLVLNIDKDTNKIIVKTGSKLKKSFELSLIEFDDENIQNIPELSFGAKVSMPSYDLTKAVGDLDFADFGIKFTTENSSFIIKGENNTMSGKLSFEETAEVEFLDERKDLTSLYPIEYLKKIIKSEKITDTVEINFNDAYPLKADYKIVDRLLLSFILSSKDED